MKKILTIAAIAALTLLASCTKEGGYGSKGKETEGTLSFASFALTEDEAVVTKASAAGNNYAIFIYDANGNLHTSTTYGAVKQEGSITLPAGEYTLEARSTEHEVPAAEFEQPVYGVTREFSITAGKTTNLGTLTCTLLQCKVTVAYNEDFLASVTGDGSASVVVTAGYPLDYELSFNGGAPSYDQSAGYFAVNGGANTTMVVTFKGSIDGKIQKMTKTFTGIQPKQWRQVKFVKKVDSKGNAIFDIQINAFVDDEELTNAISASNEIIGDDPQAPKGDGNISLAFDYDNGCDTQFTDLLDMTVPTMSERTMSLVFKITVPNGIKKFTVDIASTSSTFTTAVAAADATTLNLINPTAESMLVFDIVPFPHGTELLGQTEVVLNLSAAQEPLLSFAGEHTFTMNVTDNQGCKKSIPVKMVVR